MKPGFSEKILRRAKEKPKADTSNIMFRLPSGLLSDFRKVCEKEGLSMTKVLVELLKEFLDDRRR